MSGRGESRDLLGCEHLMRFCRAYHTVAAPICAGATWDTSSSPALPSSRKPDAPHDGPKYLPKRYAVKLDPPCIFLEYEDANGKRRVRAVSCACTHLSATACRSCVRKWFLY